MERKVNKRGVSKKVHIMPFGIYTVAIMTLYHYHTSKVCQRLWKINFMTQVSSLLTHATKSVAMSLWSLSSSCSFSPSSLCLISMPSTFRLEATDAIFSWSSSKEIWLLRVSLSSSTAYIIERKVLGKGRHALRYSR